VFRDLTADERDQLYVSRRRHKTAAVLLHELGHNLGAAHQDEPDTIMNPKYSDHSSSFDSHTRELMMATLDARLHRAHAAPRVAAAAHPKLVIVINDAGDKLVGGRAIDDATLDELLRMSFADDKDTEIVISATRKVPMKIVSGVMERAKTIGFRTLALANGYDDRAAP
jgi:biopolymer transport protein ExbD